MQRQVMLIIIIVLQIIIMPAITPGELNFQTLTRLFLLINLHIHYSHFLEELIMPTILSIF
jgi:hypothetical protein